MTSKTIPFKPMPQLPSPAAENWVGAPAVASAPEPAPAKLEGPTKRLTVDIPEDLHRRLKVKCAADGEQMSDVIRDLLLKEYPPV